MRLLQAVRCLPLHNASMNAALCSLYNLTGGDIQVIRWGTGAHLIPKSDGVPPVQRLHHHGICACLKEGAAHESSPFHNVCAHDLIAEREERVSALQNASAFSLTSEGDKDSVVLVLQA